VRGVRDEPGCQDAVNNFNGLDNFLSNGVILQVLPVLIGAFVGAPLLAREMETGTFRCTWTQGFGRWRWTLAKLVALGLAVTAAAELFSLVLGWYYQPYFNTGNYALAINEQSPFNFALFDLGRVTFAGWTLAAFAIGALAGMLIRRYSAAMSISSSRGRSQAGCSTSPSTAIRTGRATSRAAGTGRSSGSRAAGCSRCRCCSSPPLSG
jgi:ABC-type transport system involved in multi-copper enzyme maturation permease subunit